MAEQTQQSDVDRPDITIYCKSNIGGTRLGDCPFTQKVLLSLSMHKLSFEKALIDLSKEKPKSFLDLNKSTDSFKCIASDSWKGSTPVLEDRKNMVRIFDSGEIVKYLETTYKLILSPQTVAVDGSFFGNFIALIKDIGSKNNGVINDDVDKEKLDKFKNSLKSLEEHFEKNQMNASNDKDVFINGTNKISLSDIEMIPKLNLVSIVSAHALNINIAGNKSAYKNISKYIALFYQQDFWKANTFKNEDAFDIWRKKFGINSFDGKYTKNEDDVKENEEHNYPVPNTKEELYDYLCAACALELSTIPLYLTALYSFKDDEELSQSAKAAKRLVREVVMEEMLHMNLISNIISSIYGTEKIETCFNIPFGKGCNLPANIRKDIKDVSLLPFGKKVIYDQFIPIEAPTSLVRDHQPITSAKGSVIRYPFEPENGQNSVNITFRKKDDLNQIGEFYKVIQSALTSLSNDNKISFHCDNDKHKQRQCKSPKSKTSSIETLKDALEAIELICSQGEGYELKSGVFGAVTKKDDDDDLANDLETETSEKTHFIKFIECLVGRALVSLDLTQESAEMITYKFTFKESKEGGAYNVDFEKEIYPISNFEKVADSSLFDEHYAEMMKKLQKGLREADITDSIKAMHGLRDRFKECMQKKVYPSFSCPDFPLPPKI